MPYNEDAIPRWAMVFFNKGLRVLLPAAEAPLRLIMMGLSTRGINWYSWASTAASMAGSINLPITKLP